MFLIIEKKLKLLKFNKKLKMSLNIAFNWIKIVELRKKTSKIYIKNKYKSVKRVY